MSDQYIGLPTDGAGKKVDASELTVNSQTVERQRIVIADPTSATALAAVSSDGSVKVGALVSDAVNAYLDSELHPLSLATDGRLRVVTSNESYNFASWGEPEHFESNFPELGTYSAW